LTDLKLLDAVLAHQERDEPGVMLRGELQALLSRLEKLTG
jgi:hypothetical protein